MHDAIARAEADGGPALKDEATLVRAARANPVAFDLLYQHYLDPVHAYLRSRTTTPEEAADLTQQVFLQALDALPRYHGGSFAAWLFRIARNTATDAHRRRWPTMSWDQLPVTAYPIAPDDVEASALASESQVRLRQLVAALTPDKRELLMLRFAAGLRTAEIAVVLGKTDASIRQQLSRLLQNLQEHYYDGH